MNIQIDDVREYLLDLQDSICKALKEEDGLDFIEDSWDREEGGGGEGLGHPHAGSRAAPLGDEQARDGESADERGDHAGVGSRRSATATRAAVPNSNANAMPV